MSDDSGLKRIDEMLVAFSEVVDPEEKRRFLRAIVRGITDEITLIHVGFTKLTAALAIAVEGEGHGSAREMGGLIRGIGASPQEPASLGRSTRRTA